MPITQDGAGHVILASVPHSCQWFSRLASALDRRSAPRLALLFLGAILARLYVRKIDLPAIDPKHRPEFRTKTFASNIQMPTDAKQWNLTIHMPITRDMSGGKRDLSQRWCNLQS